MAHAFANGSVGLWVVNPDNLSNRLPAIAAFAGGMFTDVFVPRSATPTHMDAIRATVRPNGSKLRAQLWTAPHDLPVGEYVTQVLGDIKRLKPGVCELDIEVADAGLKQYIASTISLLRKARPKYLLRVNIAPYKAAFLPVPLFQSDPALYACEQTYYGDMSRVSEAEALIDLLSWGVPLDKATVCYGAAGPVWKPTGAQRVNTLGTLFYNGNIVAQLKRGLVFQDDLMSDAGLL